MADDPAPTEQRRLTTSDRDLDSFATDLSRWLGERVGADAPPSISGLSRPQAGGLWSSTRSECASAWRAASASGLGVLSCNASSDAARRSGNSL
ncbi:hypothetical protein [Nocardia cyriacigeorgica]|uniref:hypothetical protein n=1 Tax=Nocardia cyriacigeorgica TaxID=135487 RepID=UPI002455D270|nr:hypothetical protein [Nocardia cyriacigeorgica]